MYDYESDALEAPKSEDALAQVTRLGQELLRRQVALAAAETALDEAEKAVAEIEQDQLPALMDKLGMAEFRLTSGQTIRVEDKLKASISVERAERAFEWLEGNGQGGIIKRQLKMAFGKGQEEFAAQVCDALDALGLAGKYDVGRTVHPQTLLKTVRELLEKGELPEEAKALLGVFQKRVAGFTSGKGKGRSARENPFD